VTHITIAKILLIPHGDTDALKAPVCSPMLPRHQIEHLGPGAQTEPTEELREQRPPQGARSTFQEVEILARW
jgi:hypothetical protein